MAKENIELKWIEEGTKTDKRREITITAQLENDKLDLVHVDCFGMIICITCGALGGGDCPQLA